MKRFKTITFVLLVVFLASMFLPYEIHDVYSGGSWGSKGTLVEKDVNLFGIESIEVYAVFFLMVIIAVVTLVWRNFATSIVGVVLGFVLLVGIPFLFLTLLFQLFGPDKRMGIGLAIAMAVIITYFILLIMNLVVEFRSRKVKVKTTSYDLLDTEF